MRIVAAICLVLFSFSACSMRCSGRIVDEGTTQTDVLSYCGSPVFIDTGVYSDAETWFYKQDGMTYRLLIKQGIVYSIQYSRGGF